MSPRVETARSQAILYSAAFLLSFTPSIVLRLVEMRSGDTPFWLMFVSRILNPLQGFFNIAAFIRPQVISLRRDNPEYSNVTAFFVAIRTLNLDRFSTMRSNSRMRRSSRHLETMPNGPKGTGIKRFLKSTPKSRQRTSANMIPGDQGAVLNILEHVESADAHYDLDPDSQIKEDEKEEVLPPNNNQYSVCLIDAEENLRDTGILDKIDE